MDDLKRGIYHIKPAGRHILTIGSELIKDRYAAVVELVKNAFDADSPEVHIKFSVLKKEVDRKLVQFIQIVIADKGHGMSHDDVVDKWLVPSTDFKLKREKSFEGRMLQGRKGIGRYAASILGEDLLLETVSKTHELTTLFVEWKAFENSKYLEDVDVLVETEKTSNNPGTILTITGGNEYLELWTENELNQLRFELKKLLSPTVVVNEPSTGLQTQYNKDQFDIKLEFKNFTFEPYRDFSETLEPFPLLDIYDYRIYGKVFASGKAQLIYHNNRIPNSKEEKIDFSINLASDKVIDMDYCGDVIMDFRVYDREKSSIDNLINKGLGLRNPISKKPLTRLEAMNLLNNYNGIGVYRNGFRIRPLGDPGYDWLELDKARVLKPASRIGSNQVIGFIQIQSEEISKLFEKSARDGLKENKQYNGLKEICKLVLQRLQEKRYLYRKKAGLGRDVAKFEKKITKLFEYDDLKKEVREKLSAFGVNKSSQEIIIDLIEKKELESNRTVKELRNAIAVYQGQATLGKIVNVILHEGRSPLNVIKNETDTIEEYSKRLTEKYTIPLIESIIDSLEKIGEKVKIFVSLFKRLDPLASKTRTKKKKFELLTVVQDAFLIFENELKLCNIDYEINCTKDIKILGWKEDFFVVFTNLIDNSRYWLNTVTNVEKKITVDVYEVGNETIIDFFDNGPGIEKELIDSKIIFEPEFSRKTEGGAGLGLAISGEAIARNDGELKAIYIEGGAFFRMTIKKEKFND